MWSYGLVAYEVFDDGKGAFNPAWDDFVVKSKVLSGFRPKQRDGCPDDMYEVITKCWDVDPQKRPDFFWMRGDFEEKRQLAAEKQRRSSDPALLELS